MQISGKSFEIFEFTCYIITEDCDMLLFLPVNPSFYSFSYNIFNMSDTNIKGWEMILWFIISTNIYRVYIFTLTSYNFNKISRPLSIIFPFVLVSDISKIMYKNKNETKMGTYQGKSNLLILL